MGSVLFSGNFFSHWIFTRKWHSLSWHQTGKCHVRFQRPCQTHRFWPLQDWSLRRRQDTYKNALRDKFLHGTRNSQQRPTLWTWSRLVVFWHFGLWYDVRRTTLERKRQNWNIQVCLYCFLFDISLWFPEKIVDFLGRKTRENVVVLDFLAVDNFDFTRKIVKKKIG